MPGHEKPEPYQRRAEKEPKEEKGQCGNLLKRRFRGGKGGAPYQRRQQEGKAWHASEGCAAMRWMAGGTIAAGSMMRRSSLWFAQRTAPLFVGSRLLHRPERPFLIRVIEPSALPKVAGSRTGRDLGASV